MANTIRSQNRHSPRSNHFSLTRFNPLDVVTVPEPPVPPPPSDDFDGDDGNRKRIEIHLVQGKSASNQEVYCYLAIYAHNVADLNWSLTVNELTDLEEYGVILLTGFGKPTETAKRYIRRTYLKD